MCVQTLWQQLYVRRGLQDSLSLPGLQAKAKLRAHNRELREQLQLAGQQLQELQDKARKWLVGHDQDNHCDQDEASSTAAEDQDRTDVKS